MTQTQRGPGSNDCQGLNDHYQNDGSSVADRLDFRALADAAVDAMLVGALARQLKTLPEDADRADRRRNLAAWSVPELLQRLDHALFSAEVANWSPVQNPRTRIFAIGDHLADAADLADAAQRALTRNHATRAEIMREQNAYMLKLETQIQQLGAVPPRQRTTRQQLVRAMQELVARGVEKEIAKALLRAYAREAQA